MKQKLTENKAMELAQEFFKQIRNKEDREYHLLHSKLVSNLALVLAKDKKIDKRALKIASWVHDIGYVVDPKKHAEHSLKILERNFIIDPVLRDCILNHSAGAKPKNRRRKNIPVSR
jgi:HD superfamily phosphodiesterase